jgi:hypothetical protein
MHRLTLHPDHQCAAVQRIQIAVARLPGDLLDLRYCVYGDAALLALPQWRGASRGDQLWEHFCLEAFVRIDSAPDYCEYNFSPSGQWAAYRFSAYRTGMTETMDRIDHIAPQAGDGFFGLQARVKLEVPASAHLQIGLSAIIAEKNGSKSCWALRHPPGKPDFHHADGFALSLSGYKT